MGKSTRVSFTLDMTQEVGVFPTGPYTAWSSGDRQRAVIRKQDPHAISASGYRTIAGYSGGSASQDAVREAGDLNALDQRRQALRKES